MVTYKGMAGTLVGETSIEGESVVMWTVQLHVGVVVCEPMWCFEVTCESHLDRIQATPIEAWEDIP
jgi:hypothetical protein